MILPGSKDVIEKTLRFSFTLKLQLIFYAGLISIGSLFLPHYIKKERIIVAENQRILEQERQLALEKSKIQAQENLFLSKYSFVKSEDYKTWKAKAKDSVTNPRLKQAAFLKEREKEHLIRQKEWERIANEQEQKRVKRQKEVARLAQQEEKERKREARRQERAYAAENTYNGHTIHTGPRGGRYYYNSHGNKTYIRR